MAIEMLNQQNYALSFKVRVAAGKKISIRASIHDFSYTRTQRAHICILKQIAESFYMHDHVHNSKLSTRAETK